MENGPKLEVDLTELQTLLTKNKANASISPISRLMDENSDLFIEHDQQHDLTHDATSPEHH